MISSSLPAVMRARADADQLVKTHPLRTLADALDAASLEEGPAAAGHVVRAWAKASRAWGEYREARP